MSGPMLRLRGGDKINVEIEGRCQDQCWGRGAVSRPTLRSRGGVKNTVDVEGRYPGQC